MRTTIKLFAVFALLLGTFGQCRTASASEATTVRLTGKIASAYFSSRDPSGCIATDVRVSAGDNTARNGPGPGSPSSRVVVSINQYNLCTHTYLLSAFGFAPLADTDFQASGNLDSATLNATVNVYDSVSGSSFDVFVDLTWTGISSLHRSIFNDKREFGNCYEIRHINASWRFALASGTVSDGTTNFTPEPAEEAEIFSSKQGKISIGCG
jgi:hypothetical protein